MTAYFGTDFNNLAKLLFRCLSTINPNFDPKTYLDEFESKKTNLDKINFVYKDIKKYPTVFAKFTKDIKDDDRALEHTDSGTTKFSAGKYYEALEDYTRSAAAAKTDRVLALAYGRRSECFLKLKMPHKCIEEITRALKNNYPKEMVEDLLERQKQAELMASSTENYYENIDLEMFSKNSTIWSANDCVEIVSNEEVGKHIVATRDIEIGEILSTEQPFTTVLTDSRYNHCHHCLTLCYNLIPCNNCTMALFCSESCKSNACAYHKYECPILLTVCYRLLCEFAIDNTMLLALKVALLVKDEYSQLKYLHVKSDEYYCSDRYKEIHCLKSQATYSPIDVFHQAILTALIFELLCNNTGFFNGIFSNSETEDVFKEVLLLHLQNSLTNAPKIYELVQKYDFNGTNNFGCGAYSLFPLFSHSCCANVMKTYHGTTMVLRALNTIKKGEQCFVNRYGLRYDASPEAARQQYLYDHHLPKCNCKACREDWLPHLGDMEQICEKLDIDKMQLSDVLNSVIGVDVNNAIEFLPKLIAEVKECEDSEPTGNALAFKKMIVHCYVILGNKRLELMEGERDFIIVP